MRILEDIATKYKQLFDKTGKIEFFMHARNIERLNNDIMGVDKEVEIDQGSELTQ